MSSDSEAVTTETEEAVTNVLINKVPIYKNLQSSIKKKPRIRKIYLDISEEIQDTYSKSICLPQNKSEQQKDRRILVNIEATKLKEPNEKITIIERAVGNFTVVEDKEALANTLNASTTKGPPFSCNICQIGFMNGFKLKVHYVTNHERIHCDVCSCLFDSTAEKENHVLKFHSWLSCEICQGSFTKYTTLLQHYDQIHDSTTCIFCGILIQPKSGIHSHLEKKHCVGTNFSRIPSANIITFQDSNMCFLCGLCDKVRENNAFFGHMHSHHKISITSLLNLMRTRNMMVPVAGIDTKESEVVPEEKVISNLFPDKNRCTGCLGRYSRKVTAPFHLVYCQGKAKCKYCNKCFDDVPKRNSHIKKVHNKFYCTLGCEKIIYKTEELLNSHYLTIHKRNPCRYCDLFVEIECEDYNNHLSEQHKYKAEKMKNYVDSLFEAMENNGQKVVVCCICDENITLLFNTVRDVYSHYSNIHCISATRILELITPRPDLPGIKINKNIRIKQEFTSEDDEYENYETDESQKEISSKERTETEEESETQVDGKDEKETSDGSVNKLTQNQIKIKIKQEPDADDSEAMNNNLNSIEIPKDFNFQQIEGILNSESETEDERERFEYICDLCGKLEDCLLNLLSHLKNVHYVRSRFHEIECEHCNGKYVSSFSYAKHLLKHENVNRETFNCGCDSMVIFNSARKHILRVHLNDLDKYDLERIGLKCRFCDQRFWERTQLNDHEVALHSSSNETEFLKCYECVESFGSQKCLKNHFVQIHTDSTGYTKLNYKCQICTLVFPNIELAREHFDIEHPNDILYKCPLPNCFRTAKMKKYIKNHLKAPHSSDSMKPDPCNICGRVSKTAKAATIHKLMKHKIVRVGFQCKICGKKYNTNEQRKLHYATAHPGQSAYSCLECGKGFPSKAKLYEHKKKHKKSEKLICPYCNKEFTRKDSYNEHLLIHIGPKHQCPHCPKTFTQRSNLTRHVRIHTGTKPYKCKYCEKTFSDKGACSSHERVHTKEEHCQCTYCGKKFTKWQKLKYHMKFHTGEGLMTCEICQKQFSHTYAYKEHQRCHSHRPLTCECGKVFTKQSYLLQHKAAKHDVNNKPKYICPICNKLSDYKLAYVDHVMSHAMLKHLKCSLCEKELNSRRSMRKHIQIIHCIESLDEINKHIVQLTPEEAGLDLPPNSEFFLSIYEQVKSERNTSDIDMLQNETTNTESQSKTSDSQNQMETIVKQEVDSDDDSETSNKRKPIKNVTIKTEVFSDNELHEKSKRSSSRCESASQSSSPRKSRKSVPIKKESQLEDDKEELDEEVLQKFNDDNENNSNIKNLRQNRKRISYKMEFSSDEDEFFEQVQEDIVIETRRSRKVKKPVRYSAS